jgi:thioredoxin reductase (NADPH)
MLLDHDCLIIGGRPVGLTGAPYLARYRRKVVVYDDDESRVRSSCVPCC